LIEISPPILYHQALIKKPNAEIKASLDPKLFISDMKSCFNHNLEFVYNTVSERVRNNADVSTFIFLRYCNSGGIIPIW
jgi:hypothetical protein